MIWSLVHEMRISLVFPALFLATVLLGWKRGLLVAVLICCLAVVAESAISAENYLATLKYIPCFVVGILLALHRRSLGALLERLNGSAIALLAGIGVLAYSWTFWVNEDWFPGTLAPAVRTPVTDVVVVTFGASLIILLVQRPGRAQRVLLSRIPRFLGRISYSLYLVHALALLAVVRLIGAKVDPFLLLPLAWLISIVWADVMQRFVERPSQSLGRRLARHPAIARPDRVVLPVLRTSVGAGTGRCQTGRAWLRALAAAAYSCCIAPRRRLRRVALRGPRCARPRRSIDAAAGRRAGG